MSAIEPAHLDRATVDGLLRVAGELSGTDDLPTMLAIFARGITEVAEFECAAINLVRADGDLQVVAVAGPAEVEMVLMGVVGGRARWETELAGGQRVGAVQLHLDDSVDTDFPVWVSDDAAWFERAADHPQAWRPSYAAYVPIHETSGALLGVISVDLPRSGRIPDERQCATLEILARQAESAIVSARESAQSGLDEHTFGSVFEVAGAPMCVVDERRRVIHANRRFREHFGDLVEIQALDALLSDLEGAASLQAEVDHIFAGSSGESTFVACIGRAEDQHCFHVSLRGAAYSSTTPTRIVCTLTDISAERRAREVLRHDAEHDQLTGLLNRRGMRAAIDALVDGLGGTEVLAVLYCDLDGFKQANDLHGHRFGDGLMVKVASSLRTATPPTAVVGRAGGDEFVIVTRCATTEDAAAIADAVVSAIDLPLPGGGSVTASVGMAISTPDAVLPVVHLFQAADDVLYAAKLAGGARWMLADAPERPTAAGDGGRDRPGPRRAWPRTART